MKAEDALGRWIDAHHADQIEFLRALVRVPSDTPPGDNAPAAEKAAAVSLVMMPLAHALSFAPGQGWVNFLPQFGLGAVGGWTGLLVYVVLLGVALFVRWRSGRWQHVRI